MPEPIKTPQSPVGAQVKDLAKEKAQFNALKKSLNQITSWELAGNSWEEGIVMKFSENFAQEKADSFLKIIS